MSRNNCLLRYGRVNVLVGTLCDQLLRPVVLPHRLTGSVCHRFSVNDLPVPLEHVSLHQQHLWFMQDRAPPHFLPTVRLHLNQTFGEQWIRHGSPANWPARSPDLNPLNFWLWGHLETLVCSEAINDLEVLTRVENACQEIRVKPGIFGRVLTSVRRRAEGYVETHGNHTEQQL
jgi:hypothetical protein